MVTPLSRWSVHACRRLLHASASFCAVAGLVAMYCVLWLQRVRRVPDYELHAPWAIPAATLAGSLAFLWCAGPLFNFFYT